MVYPDTYHEELNKITRNDLIDNSIVIKKPETQPDFNEATYVELNSNGLISKIDSEKTSNGLFLTGVMSFTPAIFRYLKDDYERGTGFHNNEFYPWVSMQRMIDDGYAFKPYFYDGYYMNINTLDEYKHVLEHLSSK